MADWRCDCLRGRGGCDSLDRLANAKRGTLTGTPYSGIDGTPTAEQDWSLDALGNWASHLARNHDGQQWTDQTDHDRTHNAVNEITGISETTGPAWAAPVYDARGNMTSGPHGGAGVTAAGERG